MSGKKTPRYLIQDYADNVETEKSVHPARRRRPLSRSPEGASISQQPTVSSTTEEKTRSSTKRRRTGGEEEFTPRHLIQGLIDTQDTSKPSTRKRKKVGELLPPSSSKVKKSRRRSSLGVPTLEKMVSQFTPRSMITGFLEQGVEETPEQRAAKGDKSSSRSSFGELPNNEITFHPVEASFHETKLAKESKKTKGDRSRAAIHIVKRRSEKLARAAGEEIDFSNEDESSNDSNEDDEGAEQQRHHDLSSRHSMHVSQNEADDTSAKDTSSADPSPRKSFSRRRATPSKRESTASIKNASHSTPNKSLQVSVPSLGQLSPRETTPSKDDAPTSESDTSSKKTSESAGGSQSGSVAAKSHSKSSLQENVTEADTVEPDEANDENEEEMLDGAVDESVKGSANMSELKSRAGEVADGSDLQPSPRNKSRSRVYEHTPSKMEERIQRSSRSMSNSKIEENDGSDNLNETGLSTPSHSSKSRAHLEQSTSRSRSRSRSKSKSRLFDITDQVDEKGGNNNEMDDDDHHSSLEVRPEEFDEPRSGRSSPRYSTGRTKNVYDFHDDSPSKRIIGKLAKTLQKSSSIGENIAHRAEEEEENEGKRLYDNMSESESDEDEDHYGDEPEESIIPNTDREVRAYYTPLRTPHLKEKSSSKPVSMVTSTPKPPSEVDNHQAARGKGRPKTSEKKKGTGYMPASVVKGLFTHFCPSKVSKETIAEVEKASAQFWENAAKDLESYALHAHRKTIEESDVELLMKRQKFITPKESLPALIEKYLPLELRQEIIPICRSGNKLELK